MNRIFISYSRKDDTLLGEFVQQLDAARQNGSIQYWYDKDRDEGIQPGESFPDALRTNIQNANIFSIFLTSDWMYSPWCRKELECAVSAVKPIVPIQVRKVAPPPEAELNSRLPNDANWIGSLESRAKRDEIWFDVVAALVRMDVARTSAVAAAAPVSPRFERLVRRLARYKQIHDLVHKLLEEQLLPLETRANDLTDRTVAPESHNGHAARRTVRLASVVAPVIQRTSGQLRAVVAASVDLLENTDTADVEAVVTDLDRGTKVIADFSSRTRQDFDALVDEISRLKSILQQSLAHFGNQIEKLARAFDPIRYVQSIQTAQGARVTDIALDEEWAKMVAARHYKKLAEHVLLQDVYDRLARNIPDVTAFSTFCTDWKYIRSNVSGFADNWRAASPTDEARDDVRELRRAAAQSFDKLDALMCSDAGSSTRDWTNNVCTTVNDFVREFGVYFLEVDMTLKSEYEDIEARLDS